MKKLLWKLQYTFKLMELLALPFHMAWENAGAALENIDGDLDEDPVEMAEAEADEWGRG